MNFSFITDDLAVGTTPETFDDVALLQVAGITHIINCRDDVDDASLLIDTKIEYLWDGTKDWTPQAALGLEPKDLEWFKKAFNFWWTVRSNNLSYKLYIHCTMGVNRSATLAWAFLRALRIKDFDCDSLIDTHRPIAIFGTFADHPWRKDAAKALIEMGFLHG